MEEDLQSDPYDRPLIQVWKRGGRTSRSPSRARAEAVDAEALLCFLAEDLRLPIPTAKPFISKNEKKEMRSKTLDYEKETTEIREGLDVSRRDEWMKWKKC